MLNQFKIGRYFLRRKRERLLNLDPHHFGKLCWIDSWQPESLRQHSRDRKAEHEIVLSLQQRDGFIKRAQEILAERGTPEQREVSEPVWQGAIMDRAQMQRFYAVLGPLYSRRYDPAAAALGHERTLHEPEPLNRAFGGFLRDLDLRPELGRITAPTLVIAGRHDWICPPEFSEEIARLVPHAELRIFENSSHSVRADEPQALLDAIAGFVVYKR